MREAPALGNGTPQGSRERTADSNDESRSTTGRHIWAPLSSAEIVAVTRSRDITWRLLSHDRLRLDSGDGHGLSLFTATR
ncbi:MAG: hypothetical protein MZV63_36215 [Marinilabiliales bacterium]|nr:hypothetical protein [Marinilabiliales bacterium]